jgi:ElaB/YqjD/DUF883 family membrane-anchored ribosome-binding protein
MDAFTKENYEPSKPQSATKLTNFGKPAHNVMEGAGNPYPHSAQGSAKGPNRAATKAGEVFDKTTEKVRDSYEKARNYSLENPGKLIFITLGIGIGVGLLLGANSHHQSRTSRMVQAMVHSLSDIATEFIR